MSQARGWGAGNWASAENWSTRVRSVPTQPRMTSLHLRMTLGESGCAAIEVSADALGGERDGGEGIFDFVGDALRDFFPCELALGAEKLGGVFDDEDGAGVAVGEFETGAGDGEVHDAAAGVEFNLSGGSAHALAAAHDAGEVVGELGGQQAFDVLAAQRGVFALPHEHGEGAIGLQYVACAIERDDAAGDGFDDGLELAAALLDGQVGGGQLRGGALSARWRLASRSAAMWLKDWTSSAISPVATRATRWSYLPAAILSMASASASTGRVICLERNRASQTLRKRRQR